MQFDPKSSKFKPLMSYMEGKTCLVYDPVLTVRQTIIRLMSSFHIQGRDVFNDAKDLEAVKKYLVNKTPNFLFINTSIDDSRGIELFKLYQKIMPSKLDSAFFLMSEENSLSDAALILDYDIDGYIAQPYTFDNILEIFCTSLFKKVSKDPYILLLEEAKASFVIGDHTVAAEEFEKAESLNMPSPDHCFFQGQNYLKLNDRKSAEQSFITGLGVLPTHYKCLNALVEFYFAEKNYIDAYKHMLVILGHYPLNPEKIPLLTKLSISNQKYEDIYRYAHVFIDLPDKSEKVQKYLVAGLVLCGKFMLANDEKKKATKTFLDAAKLAQGRKEVLLQIIISLSEVEMFDHARNILTKYTGKETSNEDYLLFQFEILLRENKPNMIFKSWAELTSQGGVQNLRMHEIVLEASKLANLGETQVEQLLEAATEKFPDKIDFFKGILSI